MVRTFSMVLIYSMVAVTFISATEQKNDLQLERLISLALENNPEIQAARKMVSAKTHDVDQSGVLPDPQLSGGYFFTPVVTKEGPQDWKAGITQKLPWPGKLSTQKSVSEKELDVAVEKSRLTTLQVLSEVRRYYEKLKLLATEEEIARENLVLLEQLESVVRTKYTAASASYSYLVQIQMRMIRMRDKQISLREKFPVIVRKLEQLTGVSLAEFPFNFNTEEFEPELSSVIPEGFDSNPVLRISRLNTQIRDDKLTLARLSSRPDFLVGVDYITLDAPSDKNPLLMKAGITLPIWFGKNKALRESAQAKLSAEKLNLANVDKILRARLEEINYRLEDSRRQYLLHIQELLPLAEQNYRIAESSYLADEIDFTTYLDVEEDLLDLKLITARLRYSYYVAAADHFELTAKEF